MDKFNVGDGISKYTNIKSAYWCPKGQNYQAGKGCVDNMENISSNLMATGINLDYWTKQDKESKKKAKVKSRAADGEYNFDAWGSAFELGSAGLGVYTQEQQRLAAVKAREEAEKQRLHELEMQRLSGGAKSSKVGMSIGATVALVLGSVALLGMYYAFKNK